MTISNEAATKECDSLIASLVSKGVPVDSLYVMLVGSEYIIGEALGAMPGTIVNVSNPKRLIRIQQIQGGAISVTLMIGELDLLEGGSVFVQPSLSYPVRGQSVDSQLSILGLYKDYLDRKIMNKASEAGLVLPNQSPFRK